MLKDLADYVLIGHPERRASGETDEQIARKVAAAESGSSPSCSSVRTSPARRPSPRSSSGWPATRALKQVLPEVKVVMLTAYTNEAVLVAAIEAGCSGYITKHVGARIVAKGIRLAASGEALVTAAMLQQLLPRLSRTDRGTGPGLTPREREVLELLADGASTQAIAERLYLSSNTVRNHVQKILAKLGVHSRLEAVSTAVRQGVIERG